MRYIALMVIFVFMLGERIAADPLPEFLIIESVTKPGPSVYEDVIAHFEKPYGDSSGRSTNVHETAHGIHSQERNKHFKTIGRCNAFYCLKGRVVVLREPRLKMEHIEIPTVARSYRHALYFKEQLKYWNDTPTYPLDEWSAYILGAECAVEDHESGIETEKSDAVSGCLEFSIYSLATAKAIKEKDPDYWFQEENFRKFMKFNLDRAERAFFAGRYIFKSEKQEKLLEDFRNHDECEPIRKFMSEEFGEFFLRDSFR